MRWSPKLESELEEILVRNQFDFKQTGREFERLLNRTEGTNEIVFKVDPKTLQLRWTDIEIRRHVMPAQQASSEEENAHLDDDDELPPLEEETPAEAAARQTSSKLIKYDSESASDSDAGAVNDLEELD